MADQQPLHGLPVTRRATFRFYEELNDFLPRHRRKVAFEHLLEGTPSIGDTIEALGVPAGEIDLILVDGESVPFGHRLRGGERVAVYPEFERFDIAPLSRLRARPLRRPRFVLDSHLSQLARMLRLIGFDALYGNRSTNAELVELARSGPRILLTRDRGLLEHPDLTHSYLVRSADPERQLRDVVENLDLARLCEPFSCCVVCNTVLETVEEQVVRAHGASVLHEHPRGPAGRQTHK